MMNDLFVRLLAALQTREQSGQGLVEYALILSLVSIACIAAMIALAGGINATFAAILAAL